MLKKFLPILIALLFIIIYSISAIKVDASTIFEDDFNSYPNNTFPTNWITFHSPFDAPQCNTSTFVDSGILKISIPQSSCTYHLIPNSTAWPTMQDNYVFETDIRFISGTDRHIIYRLDPVTPHFWGLHFFIPGDFEVATDNPNFITNISTSLTFNHTYHIKMVVTDIELQVYIGDPGGNLDLVRDVYHLAPIPAGTIGIGSSPGGGSLTETWFDNIRVTTLDNNDLNVPLIKQTNPLWANDVYDSANAWSNGDTNIGRWGCAITSATMVLHYYNITKLPNGQDLTPGTLNSYLTSIPDGYKPDGVTNWHAIASMTKKAKPFNPNFAYDALEDQYSGANDIAQVTNDLNNSMPDILQENLGGGNMHFVVAKGIGNSTFTINDPAFNRTDLSPYNNTFASVKRYIPSNTDLSYLMFVVDPTVNIVLKDNQDNPIGDVFTEYPIADPLNILINTKGPIKVVNFAKPTTGKYSVEISSNDSRSYTLISYLYDKNGEVKMHNDSGYVGSGNVDTYNIQEDIDDLSSSSISQKTPTFDSLLNDVSILQQLGHITKKGSYNFLIREITKAQGYYSTDLARTKSLLENIRQQLLDDKKRGIDVEASSYIINQLDLLLASF